MCSVSHPVSDMSPTNIYEALAAFDEIYSPRIVNRVNDYHVKIAHASGDHVWHAHPETDEFFLVLDGEFTVAWRGTDGVVTEVVLAKGDTFVVPRGVQHKPSSRGGSILMFEPVGTASTGDVDEDDLPAHLSRSTGLEPAN